ncbi:hypothetical protein HaLaN_20868 [Haematococcus lacustris]|uniref:Uncharacterized protein n=1 Tax=Haematococcus lacustris TaxID=44745 RepID=A0A699ZKJ5_HAELA|nr:hypothetical protein HaLaN_20868 [Haematococcus lacustris]
MESTGEAAVQPPHPSRMHEHLTMAGQGTSTKPTSLPQPHKELALAGATVMRSMNGCDSPLRSQQQLPQ